tara:strand:- start:104 stop:676 length:573 start_codon:yes stop_codon:yes gene_type:complete
VKAYTIKIEALVISDSSIESSTPEQVLDLIIDHTDTMTATIVPMVCGDARVAEPAPRMSIVSEPQTTHTPLDVPNEPPAIQEFSKNGEKIISTNRSWAQQKPHGVMEFFDSSTGEVFQTSKQWRFRQSTGCPEFKYGSHDYVSYCMRRPIGTYESRDIKNHVYLTRSEATEVRDHIYSGRMIRKQLKGGE